MAIAADWDRWPASVTWSRDAGDGQVLIVTADEGGRRPVFRIGIRDGGVEALTTDDYAYTDVTAAPGGVIYALRSSYAAPLPTGRSTQIVVVSRNATATPNSSASVASMTCFWTSP